MNKITKEDIEQFKKDCKARGLKLPENVTDEWCIEQLKELWGGRMIIKNCGCNPSCDECYINCNKIPDCLLKQIVKECQEVQVKVNGKYISPSKAKFGRKILSLLEIEE